MEISVMEILAARDKRAATQKRLLETFGKSLICFTMNIAGPVKYSPAILRGFQLGKRLLETQLTNILHFEESISPTGCEGFYVADASARELKQLCVMIEDSAPLCRLFDMDVLDETGNKLSRQALGLPGRTCLLCQEPAHVCSSTRAHTVKQLQAETARLLEAADEYTYIASLAYQALIREVLTTPKPGLVDSANSGAHRDMDMRTFFASAAALRPYFYEAARIGNLGLSPRDTFLRLRPAGLTAEKAMLAATGGVNTHKGAIFTMGLLCAAAARQTETADILGECAAMTEGIVKQDLGGITEATAQTAGQRLYAKYGITGIRGQAETGFPAVKYVGLPVLRQGLAKGLDWNDAGCAALLHILCATEDTNLIARSDLRTAREVTGRVAAILEDTPFPTRDVLQALDREFTRKNISPGGSADLLCATYFLYLRSKTCGAAQTQE